MLRDARGLTHGSRLRPLICSHGTHSHCNSPERGAPAAPGHPRPWSGEWKEVPVLLRLEGGSRGILGLWCRSSLGHCLSPLRSPGMLLGTGSSARAQPQPRLLGKSRKKITGLRCPQDLEGSPWNLYPPKPCCSARTRQVLPLSPWGQRTGLGMGRAVLGPTSRGCAGGIHALEKDPSPVGPSQHTLSQCRPREGFGSPGCAKAGNSLKCPPGMGLQVSLRNGRRVRGKLSIPAMGMKSHGHLVPLGQLGPCGSSRSPNSWKNPH